MTLHVSVAEVQQWLETTKATITSVDVELEASAFAQVSSALAPLYAPETWVDASTTPDLVRKIISMYVAGWTYNKQYSENRPEGGSSWGDRLTQMADRLLQGLSSGLLELTGTVPGVRDTWSYPSFFPTDAATDAADPLLGGDPSDPNAAPRAFTMGQIF